VRYEVLRPRKNEPDSSGGIATAYMLDDKRGRSSSPGRFKNFLFFASSRPVLGPNEPPIQWVLGVKLTTHLQLLPRSRKRGSIQPLPHTSSWRSA
jgi:hypothetical protein